MTTVRCGTTFGRGRIEEYPAPLQLAAGFPGPSLVIHAAHGTPVTAFPLWQRPRRAVR